MKILTEATPLALWYEAVQTAQLDRHIALKTEVESYLVFMLMRHINNPTLAQEIMALKFLDGFHSPLHQRSIILQNVGDQCLLITGLFPGLATKRRLKIKYYIELGQISYEVISQKNNDIFSLLSKQFMILTDVLQSVRPEYATAIPVESCTSWDEAPGLSKSLPKHNKK